MNTDTDNALPDSTAAASAAAIAPQPPQVTHEAAADLQDAAQAQAEGMPAPVPLALPGWAPPLPDVRELDRFDHEAYRYSPEQLLDVPAASPLDYELPLMVDSEEVSEEELVATRGITSLLWHANFPKVDGDRLLATMSAEARRVGDEVSDDAFEAQCRETDATLEGMYGRDKYWELRGQLADFLEDLDKKAPDGIGDILEAYAHVFATPRVMSELLAHVSRTPARVRRRFPR